MIITSTANRHIVEARKLRRRKHRQEQGLFLLEGLQLLTMALDAGLRPRQVFTCPDQLTGAQGPALIDRFAQTPADFRFASAVAASTRNLADSPCSPRSWPASQAT